jgi:hypothetical protein
MLPTASVRNFLRAMGAIYVAAFLSFGVQAAGLIGSQGILPATDYLAAAAQSLGARAWWLVPTLFWLAPHDWMLATIWVIGTLCGLIALAGWRQHVMLAICWLLWLGLCSVGQEFLGYQWDMLLLEAGFLSIFAGPSLVPVWLFRFLLFRLMFASGVVKLASGDAAWRSLRALNYHYATQPLPTPLAWFMQQLPDGFQRASTAMVLVIELAVPFLYFAPRRLRIVGAWATIGFQMLILLTGNYAYFNWLTIALTLWLFIEPERRVVRASIPLAVVVGGLGLMLLPGLFGIELPEILDQAAGLVSPLRLVNSYGLFAVMTTTRPEIQVEGSNDGENWQVYEFRYKPGDGRRAPPIVAPHQPRLDWQMWFAALGRVEQNRWFVSFVEKLLRGEPAVLRLLARNPFPNGPPRYIRAQLFQYHFTHWGEPGWWRREESGIYLPPVSLRQ